MKYIILIAILISFTIQSCILFKESRVTDEIPGFSNELFQVVDTLKISEISFDNDSLLEIFFFAEKGHCFLYVFPTFYYNPGKIIGSFKYKDWHVLVNSSDGNCFMNHVIPEDLPKESIPETFLKQNELGDMIVDPYGMKYEVYKDSIVLVYKGFF